MKTRSAKNKGKRLQNLLRDEILKKYPTLEMDDVKSTTMGESGEDVQLSPAARKLFPFSVECKNNKKFALYKIMEQAESNCGLHIPLLCLKADYKRPIIVLYLDDFMDKIL